MKHDYSLIVKNLIKNSKFYCLIFAALFFVSNTFGQSNNCDNTALFTVNATCMYVPFVANNGTSTYLDASGTGCSADNSIDAWASFVATSTQTTIDYIPGAYDAIMTIYSGTCGALNYETCSNAVGVAAMESITLTTVVGTTYRIRVQSASLPLATGVICIYDAAASGTPASDEPCTATPLTVNATCTFSTFDSTGATDSSPADPGCADYQGQDVWFSAVVPASGNLTIDTDDNGTVTDSGIALYTGTCGALTLVECNDDDSPNGGLMSTITRSGLTPGSTVYIRFWEYGGGTGTFDICANDPPPCVQPTTDPATPVSYTTATINWTGTAPAPDIGYEYFVSTSNTAPTGGGTAWAGTSRALTGLTNGTTYYVFVRSNCGSGLYSPWDGPVAFSTLAYSPCVTPGPATTLVFGAIDDNSIAGSFTAPAPVADGYLILMNTTGVAPAAPIDGITYNIGETVSSATVVDNDTNTVFTATGLTFSTQYYFYIYAYNDDSCLNAPAYSNTSLTGNATTTACLASSTNSSNYIDDFDATGDGVSNITNNNTGAGTGTGYNDYTAMTVSQLEGGTVFFNANFNGTYGFNIWIDFNDDLNFNAGELVYFSGTYVGGVTTGSFVIPGGSAGTHVMRIRADDLATSPSPCGNITWGEAEDYTITITPLDCTSDPSNVTATPTTTTTADISWDPAAPAPANGYDYVLSTSPTGTPVTASGTIPGTSVTNIAVVANETYYVFVRGNCGNGDGQGVWYTDSFNTGCADLVTTATADPMIIGQQGVNPLIADPFIADPSFSVDCSSGSLTLEAYSDLHETTSYVVEKIAYNPPVPYTSFAASSVNITSDDIWSPSYSSLGFDFCFYGNTYSQCLVGANVAVTFNPTVTPGSFLGWTMGDLPGTTGGLLEHTIFGVFHDVNPAASTTDEITTRVLNSTNIGYRKFVVAWHDVPMFGDSTKLYTGMIVLHETTNIIEVFIEEKRIVGWNSGNALVGIQGDYVGSGNPSNEFAVAPCRNGLDTNWEITDEAWRFVPDGAAIPATSVTWYQGSGTSGANLGTSTTLSVTSPNTYTAAATYATCNGLVTILDEVLVTGSGKTWNGSSSSDWNTAANWTPSGVPTNTDCVIIPSNASTNNDATVTGTTATCYYLSIESGGSLNVVPTGAITVVDAVSVEGGAIFELEGFEYNTGSLIQVNDVVNSGTITMNRDTNVRRQDYVYWSSPVANFPLTSVSPTTSSSLIYEWIPTVDRGIGPPPGNIPLIYGEWQTASGNMTDAKGYIIRGPSAFDNATPAWYSASFTGTPNNGDITISINRGTYTGTPYNDQGGQVTNEDDNYNLVGNPYPSALDARDFLTLNTTIDGTVYLWTHGSRINSGYGSPFYGTYSYNYNQSDYLEYNLSGPSTQSGFDGYIGSGQGFFVLMEEAPNAGTNEALTFNNSMRSSAHENDQFFRSDSNNTVVIQKDRIWLDLVSPSEVTSTTLVAYVAEATNQDDRLYDASTIGGPGKNLYSVLGDEEYIIQGRQHPLDINDQVPLGMSIEELGEYAIAIHGIDGVFTDGNQNIYIEDLLLGVTHDIKAAPYFFTTNTLGDYNDRFVLRYTDATLGLNDVNNPQGLTIIAPNGAYVKINSQNEMIDSVILYDLLGRVLVDKREVNDFEFIIDQNAFSNGAYIVKATLTNGKQKIQKIVLK
ncbi:hypothetical protein A9Q87_06480 [Flavobacteriales bacterium 34_180_T64]|nr:hypothetical protein A9Q87_06480 [Flavobacteriales bacterium 34_180_T64]